MRLYDLKRNDLRPETSRIEAGVRPCCFLSGSVCALGGFDGVHIGHAAILRRAAETASEIGTAPAVWTFDTAPGAMSSASISTLTQRLRLFRENGMDFAVLESFDEIRSMPADEFVRTVLIGTMGCRVAVCGYNFTFGRGGEGHSADLCRLMRQYGGDAETVGEIRLKGDTVSSSRVRSLISDGDVKTAAELLGRPFTVEGEIIHGRHLGHTIGIPTCNQALPDGVVTPKLGVYASEITVDGKTYPSVTNIGMRPTVADLPGGDSCPVAETHIISNGIPDMYGKTAVTSLLGFIREERKFSSVGELAAQMKKDSDARMSGIK